MNDLMNGAGGGTLEAESWQETFIPIGLFWFCLQVPDKDVQINPSLPFKFPVDCVAELPGT